MNQLRERLAPFVFGMLALGLWQGSVWALAVPSYVVPGPIAIFNAYLSDYAILNPALLSTLTVTFTALLAATLLGVFLAVAMAASTLFRAAIQPWAVILQVTPVVAIAPLIIIWVNQPFVALVVCATIVAFFPILSNTAAGLAATPPELLDLFHLNGATRWQTLFLLRLPAALPNFLTGLRISGTLALVGAVVAEFVAGSGGFASGLAYRIIEASYRLEIPRMFAALVLLGVSGIIIYAALGLLERFLLRKRNAA
ncbi:ABC transporter permease [Acidocella sp.]|uniref:ABC transporter permease n=1 Tax=Acidocella sp. TaxID=50710 RepID=UPI0026396803|nr:ABC transporter permease [Acidocella sp.]MDD2796270.1 ABC transporter permease [Acidocella sp.]